MGNKVNPKSLRLPLTLDWESRWFASKKDFSKYLIEDIKVRQAINNHYSSNSGISRIIIKRDRDDINLDIFTAKPGILIGRQGKGINDLKIKLEKLVTSKIRINIVEIRKADLDATLVAGNIGNQISRRISFRRAMKQAMEKVMQAGAKGVKIRLSGRLGGAEIARKETTNVGSIPASSLKKNIDFSIVHAPTTYGIIGIKVWINKGDLIIDDQNQNNISRPLV